MTRQSKTPFRFFEAYSYSVSSIRWRYMSVYVIGSPDAETAPAKPRPADRLRDCFFPACHLNLSGIFFYFLPAHKAVWYAKAV